MTGQRTIDILRCAKPMMFENSDENYAYSMLGTCTVVKFQGCLFGITAAHTLEGRLPASVRVRMIPNQLTWLSILAIHSLRGDGDCYDLAVFEFSAQLASREWLESPACLDLSGSMISLQPPPTGALLAVAGFPAAVNTIDYEKKQLSTAGFSADGRCVGPAEQPRCSMMRFNNLEGIDDLNGLSGSPVFRFDEITEGVYTTAFVGILIQGTAASGVGRFIDARFVIEALEKILLRTSASRSQK